VHVRANHRRARSSRTRRGFTLVELLLVVTLIALIGSVGNGMYANSYKKLLVQKAARQFLLTARYARIVAIEQNRPYELVMDAKNGKFCLTTSLPNQETGETEKTVVKDYYSKPVQMEGNVRFEKIDVATSAISPTADDQSEQTISFLPTGSMQSAVVQIGDDAWHYCVVLTAATGQVTLHDGLAEQVKLPVIDLDEEGQR
jgi:prepilin-type N-terminal cleavage/methylation domain-containing protein